MKKDIRAYGYEELQKEMATIGEKAFRAKQIYEWLHVKLVDHFDEMTNLSKALREKLEENYEILPVVMLERQISQIDGTNKFLFRLYFLPGRLQDGMCILCINDRRSGEKSFSV